MNKLWPLLILLFYACKQKHFNADLLVKNAVIYTVDSNFTTAEAMVITDGKIVSVGRSDELEEQYQAKKIIDAQGKAVFPGFIDAHAHFYNYGLSLSEVNVSGTQSWNEVMDTIRNYARINPDGWLIGRGWDQNEWKEKHFPNKDLLDQYFPVRPVLIQRIDGHAAIANTAALKIAGIEPGMSIDGGNIETIDGKLTGILIDNAVNLVRNKIPSPDDNQVQNAFLNAQEHCLAVGLTTVVDCGLDFAKVNTIEQMHRKGNLKMRMYVMLTGDSANLDYLEKNGVLKTPKLNVRSIKVFADGALGSRGACLIKPYTDQDNWYGMMLNDTVKLKALAQWALLNEVQMATHAIGDSANRVVLQIYADALKGKNDLRWRIEHAQLVDPADMPVFGRNNIIPSVQPTHATSDMHWALKRLGQERLKHAYAYQELLKQNNWLPLGTDFPVENINPLYSFYAAVERKDLNGLPASGFQKQNALNRKQALQGITSWAAKANFEENEKGSIAPGKFADFVILDKDIMKIKAEEIPGVKVLQTYINGELVYEKK
jgi:predicted amidohydrolase YtcJ